MIRLCACIEPFFDGLSYLEKIKRAAKLGFKHYEFWFHNLAFEKGGLREERKDFEAVAKINNDLGITLNDFVFNHPDGGTKADLINRYHRQKLVDGLREIIPLARMTGCKRLICGSGNKNQGQAPKAAVRAMIDNLKLLARICEKEDITLILEPFNTRVDHPDYFLDDPYTAVDVVRQVGSDHVKILFDIYHMQIMAGNITAFVRENLAHIGHFHIAGVPGRHEPVDGELDYRWILKEIDSMGYEGAFGLEYWPSLDDTKSLKQTRSYLLS